MPSRNLIIVDHPEQWKFRDLHADVVSTLEYLSSDFPAIKGSVRVFNLSQSYRYQSLGYYVSLLAEARGHVPRPGVDNIRDLGMLGVARVFSEEIDERIQTSLKRVPEPEITLRIFCGRTRRAELDKLARDLYRLFPVPMLEVGFLRRDSWRMGSIRPLTLSHLSPEEKEELEKALRETLISPEPRKRPARRILYDLAIAVDPSESHPPSDEEALQNFEDAAREVGFYVERIRTADIGRINEFDALFIRQTTAVDKPIYRLSRMAHAEGLVVIDDPWSILRSGNKIFLAESLDRAGLPSPGSWVVTRRDLRPGGIDHLPHPCVLKVPDGSFSREVRKSDSPEETRVLLTEMFKRSELILVQEFLPSGFDWRIGILGGEPLFACKYHMAKGHWQIYNWERVGKPDQAGVHETFPLYAVPPKVLQTALRSAALMGDGFYGVDLKETPDGIRVIEVNDNPNLDAGVEDEAGGREIYLRLAHHFRDRIESARR